MSDDGFLSRWARRKAQVKRGPAPADEPPVASSSLQPLVPAVRQQTPLPPPNEAPADPPPTLGDVAELTPASDFSRFVTPSVDNSVKQAALKKLFTDPHFNVMDGLDTYIEDYGRPDPIPPAMLRQLAQSKFLGLFEDEEKDDKQQQQPKASPDGATLAEVPQSPTHLQAVPPDENPDLRLQQDDAAGPGGTEPSRRA